MARTVRRAREPKQRREGIPQPWYGARSPLWEMVALVVFVFLARSNRRWGTLGVVGLCLLAVLTLVGSLGEAFATDTPDVPREVLIASGVLGVVLGPLLLFFGIAELRDRATPGRISEHALQANFRQRPF